MRSFDLIEGLTTWGADIDLDFVSKGKNSSGLNLRNYSLQVISRAVYIRSLEGGRSVLDAAYVRDEILLEVGLLGNAGRKGW